MKVNLCVPFTWVHIGKSKELNDKAFSCVSQGFIFYFGMK